MANILILFPSEDLSLFHRLSDFLVGNQHTVLSENDITEGNQTPLPEQIKDLIDFTFVIISAKNGTNLLYNQHYSNIVAVLIKEKIPIIPLIEIGANTPMELQSIISIKFESSQFNNIFNTINTSIIRASKLKDINNQKKIEIREKIETNLSSYIEDVSNKLEEREKRNSLIGSTWNIIGFLILMFGTFIAYKSMLDVFKTPEGPIAYQILVSFKLIAILSMLGASSRYAFLLGKAYSHEALRAADRTHAIEFGKFYLRAYGDRITDPKEIQNIFQTWNIDSGSQFSKIAPEGVDPKILEKIVDAFTKVAGKDK